MANQRTRLRWTTSAWGASGALGVVLALSFWNPVTASARSRAQDSGSRAASSAKKRPSAAASSETSEAGRRDPFKIPPPPGKGGISGIVGPLPPGKRGLVIDQLVLEGVVREDKTNSMIAVVTNKTDRAYFLRENDEVYNGVVSKITPDAVYFQENALQGNGRLTSHVVIKRLHAGPGEGR